MKERNQFSLPKFSIIVPVYNTEKYLRRCLNSILIQSFIDYEIILVDDGSTDNSGIICDEYSKKYEKIKTFHKINEGLSSARNYGMRYALGNYFVFVDSDDWIEKNYLEIINNFANNSFDLICFGYYIDYSGEKYSLNRVVKEKEYCKSELADAISSLECDGMFNSVCNKCYKSCLLKDKDIQFVLNLEPGEDLIFNCSFFQNIESCVCVKEQLYHYMRQGELTLTKRFDSELYDKIQLFYKARFDLYSSLCMDLEEKNFYLSKYYFEYVLSCIYNVYGSRESNNKQSVLRKVIDDSKLSNSVNYLLNSNKKIFNTFNYRWFLFFYDKKRVWLLRLAYGFLFFFRNRFQKLYIMFRKRMFLKQLREKNE